MLTVSDAPIDAPALLKAFEESAGAAGAIVTFSGLVRPSASKGDVETLYLQAYPAMTESGIEAAMQETQARWSVSHLQVVHRTGEMKPGDTIVFVAAASAHRREAFEAADFLMDYLKTRAVFWKREDTAAGPQWIEPRAEDYEDAKRWDTASKK
ncbi:MAG: molybdenum cofactor biosynthesis protein MoaE [Pseudomonadota bacterium]